MREHHRRSIVEQLRDGAWDEARSLVEVHERRARLMLALRCGFGAVLVGIGGLAWLDREASLIAAVGVCVYATVRFVQTRIRVDDIDRSELLAGVMKGSAVVVSDDEWTAADIETLARYGFAGIDLGRELSQFPDTADTELIRAFLLTATSSATPCAIRVPPSLAHTDELSASLHLVTTVRGSDAQSDSLGDLPRLVGKGVPSSLLLFDGTNEELFLARLRRHIPSIGWMTRRPRSRVVVVVDSSRRDALNLARLAGNSLSGFIVRATAQPELIQQDLESWPTFVARRQLKLAFRDDSDVILGVSTADMLLASYRAARLAGRFSAIIATDRAGEGYLNEVVVDSAERTAQEIASDIAAACGALPSGNGRDRTI